MRVKFVDVMGVPTRCLYAGNQEAPPILLIHGRALMAEVWLRNIDELGRVFFVIAPDVLGNGFTGPVDFGAGDEPAIAARLRHLCALVEALGWNTFCACGSSHGALLAALMYLRMPRRVTHLVLNGSAACASPDEDLKNLMARTLADEAAIASATLDDWRARCSKGVHNPSAIPPELPSALLTAYAQPWVRKAWKDSLLSQMDVAGIRDYRILHRLGDFDVDTLVPWGLQDHGAPYDYGVAMVEGMPRARLETFDACGHTPMLEHPDRFNAMIRSFILG